LSLSASGARAKAGTDSRCIELVYKRARESAQRWRRIYTTEIRTPLGNPVTTYGERQAHQTPTVPVVFVLRHLGLLSPQMLSPTRFSWLKYPSQSMQWCLSLAASDSGKRSKTSGGSETRWPIFGIDEPPSSQGNLISRQQRISLVGLFFCPE
jgi:hypothetical protein